MELSSILRDSQARVIYPTYVGDKEEVVIAGEPRTTRTLGWNSSAGGVVGPKSSSGKLGWWFRLVKPAFARGRRPGHVMRPTLDRPERQKPPGSLPAAALLRRLLRGFVDARLVALAPGAGDLDPGLLGQRADEAPDGVLLPTCGVHNLLQCGAAGADQEEIGRASCRERV